MIRTAKAVFCGGPLDGKVMCFPAKRWAAEDGTQYFRTFTGLFWDAKSREVIPEFDIFIPLPGGMMPDRKKVSYLWRKKMERRGS